MGSFHQITKNVEVPKKKCYYSSSLPNLTSRTATIITTTCLIHHTSPIPLFLPLQQTLHKSSHFSKQDPTKHQQIQHHHSRWRPTVTTIVSRVPLIYNTLTTQSPNNPSKGNGKKKHWRSQKSIHLLHPVAAITTA